jgi:hypothetical protein
MDLITFQGVVMAPSNKVVWVAMTTAHASESAAATARIRVTICLGQQGGEIKKPSAPKAWRALRNSSGKL